MFFLLNSKTDITGAVVGVSNISSGISSIFGIVFILISAMLFVGGESLEEKVNIKSFRKKLEKTERRKIPYEEAEKGYKSKTIRELSLSGRVPLDEAIKIYDDANQKTESGEWIELSRSRDADYAIGEDYRYNFKSGGSLQEASPYRFFGPKKILRDYQKKEIEKRLKKQQSIKKTKRKSRLQITKDVLREIRTLPENVVERYFKRGIIPGKIHEIFGGYEFHGENENYEKVDGKWRRKSFTGPIRKEESKFSEYSVSGESSAGSTHHRHWELEDMYRYKNKRKDR